MYKSIFYYGAVKIAPTSNYLSSNLIIKVSSAKKAFKHKFILQKSVVINSLDAKDLKEYRLLAGNNNPFMEDAKTVELVFSEQVQDFELNISYCLRFKINGKWETNRITPNWTELGLYSPWYPYFDKALVTYRLTIDIIDNYELISIGALSKNKKYKLKHDMPTISILLLIAKKFLTIEDEPSYIKVRYPHHIKKDFAKFISIESKNLYQSLKELLGKPTRSDSIDFVVADRDKAGGYVRDGLIVIQNIKDYEAKKERYIYWLAHELAHLWWYKADTNSWEDWLNESYAEYYSFMVLEEVLGEDYLSKKIEEKREISADLPPIRDILRTDDKAYNVLYHKGFLLLYDLANMVGQDKFQAFSKTFSQLTEYDTEIWLNSLRNSFNDCVYNFAMRKLEE